MLLTSAPSFRTWTISTTFGALLLFACGGAERLSLGESGETVTSCSPDKCTEVIACAGGTPTNVQCVPDPNAGQGSLPVGACKTVYDCDFDAGAPVLDAGVSCSPADCTGGLDCVRGTPTNVRCEPNPVTGRGIPACVSVFDCDTGSDVDAGPAEDPCVPKGGNCTSMVCAGAQHIDTSVTCPASQWCCVVDDGGI